MNKTIWSRIGLHHVLLTSAVLAVSGLFLAVSLANSTDHPGIREMSRRVGGPAAQQRMRKIDHLSSEGQAALYRKNYALAERKLRQSITLDGLGGDSETWIALGRALDAQGHGQEAYAAYREAFDSPTRRGSSSFPKSMEALTHYGVMCENNGQHNAAVRAYNKAIEELNPESQAVSLKVPTDPKETPAPHLRALLNIVRGLTIEREKDFSGKDRSQDALKAFQQAAQQQPDDAIVQFYHGYGLRKAGQFAEAQAAFQRAAALDTEGPVKAAAEESLRAVQAHRR